MFDFRNNYSDSVYYERIFYLALNYVIKSFRPQNFSNIHRIWGPIEAEGIYKQALGRRERLSK
jgi:hypothetical protein